MRFDLTDAQRALRDAVREFTTETIEPQARALDRDETYPSSIVDERGDRRLTGLTLPEAYGGAGWRPRRIRVADRRIIGGLMSVASTVGLHLGVATVIEHFGTDAQRAALLPEMASFETVGALGVSEANAGSNKRQMETTADRDSNEWVLNGHKQWVTNFRGADYVLTYAKTGPEGDTAERGRCKRKRRCTNDECHGSTFQAASSAAARIATRVAPESKRSLEIGPQRLASGWERL